jgi:hypothetical protein
MRARTVRHRTADHETGDDVSNWERIETGFYRYRKSREPADVVKVGPRKWEATYRPRNGSRVTESFRTAAAAKWRIETRLR